MAAEDEVEEPERSPIDQVDMIKSYLAFAWRSLKQRKLMAGLVFAVVFGASIAALAVWPRTYHCESTIMVQGSGALVGGDGNAFRGAADIIRRRENLQRIAKETDLARRALADRTGPQKFKDTLLGRGNLRPEDIEGGLIWTLQSSLWVQQAGDTLTFGVDWGNAEMTAKLVAAAQKVYLEARHVAEISTVQEKMAIMDGHAIKVRKEIDSIAEQLKSVREDKIAAIGKASQTAPPAPSTPAGTSSSPAPRPRPAPIKISTVVTTAVSETELAARKEQLTTLRDDLEAKKRQIKELKGQQSQALVAAQAQKAELLTRYTPAHPEVRVLERRIQSLTEESPRIAPLEAEVAQLTARIKELEQSPASTASVVTRTRPGGGASTAASQPKTEALPADILKLLDSGEETDPAITVQLQGAISRYAGLRDGIRAARLELDTAQAAFNHRYKIIEPPEPPLKPSKPNVRSGAMSGFAAALLLALLLPMLMELRKGKIIERWQVYQMKLPILGELRLPSGSRD
jgi:polysaccharide biosynthesis transport protein